MIGRTVQRARHAAALFGTTAGAARARRRLGTSYRAVVAGSEDPPARRSRPVIVVGMHRSGTSIVTRMVEALGIHMGGEQGPDTNEALHFRRCNQQMFELCHGAWDRPLAVLDMLRHDDWVRAFSRLCAAGLTSHSADRFWRDVEGVGFDQSGWGFKDPRTSITLPVWLRLFPEALVIRVDRSADPVAESLMVRSRRAISNGGALSIRVLEPEGGRQLHREYNDALDGHLARFAATEALGPGRLHVIQYEGLVEDPAAAADALAAFLEPLGMAGRPAAAAQLVRRST